MKYECAPSRLTPDEWVVEAIDTDSEGEVYVALFSGPDAKGQAEEYAAWKTWRDLLDATEDDPLASARRDDVKGEIEAALQKERSRIGGVFNRMSQLRRDAIGGMDTLAFFMHLLGNKIADGDDDGRD